MLPCNGSTPLHPSKPSASPLAPVLDDHDDDGDDDDDGNDDDDDDDDDDDGDGTWSISRARTRARVYTPGRSNEPCAFMSTHHTPLHRRSVNTWVRVRARRASSRASVCITPARKAFLRRIKSRDERVTPT